MLMDNLDGNCDQKAELLIIAGIYARRFSVYN